MHSQAETVLLEISFNLLALAILGSSNGLCVRGLRDVELHAVPLISPRVLLDLPHTGIVGGRALELGTRVGKPGLRGRRRGCSHGLRGALHQLRLNRCCVHDAQLLQRHLELLDAHSLLARVRKEEPLLSAPGRPAHRVLHSPLQIAPRAAGVKEQLQRGRSTARPHDAEAQLGPRGLVGPALPGAQGHAPGVLDAADDVLDAGPIQPRALDPARVAVDPVDPPGVGGQSHGVGVLEARDDALHRGPVQVGPEDGPGAKIGPVDLAMLRVDRNAIRVLAVGHQGFST
mmetsp:Transcript_26551/g.76458  ORF Transcript_26551/g.76458 Transcript_26551/m.76458 type:complete len:287 (+) Transcript_26551:521-1381(+)